MKPNQSFPKSVRLRKQREFDRVFAGKTYAADNVLVVTACPNDSDRSRLGLSVSRKVGNAVLRNRWKRCIRNAFRTQQHTLPRGIDIVVRPRRGAELDAAAIQKSLPRLCRKIAKRLNLE